MWFVLWINSEEPEDPIYEIIGPFAEESEAMEWTNTAMDRLDAEGDHSIELHVTTATKPSYANEVKEQEATEWLSIWSEWRDNLLS